jgi:carbonic anhydrase
MEHVVSGTLRFKRDVFPGHKELFGELANGQSPEVLFVTCADSRIDPNLVTQTKPGELFICRNAGNIVPPHVSQAGGVTASIEYAVAVLGVQHIVVCGHTDCGAMKGALATEALSDLPHVKEWLEHARSAVEVVKARHGNCGPEHLDEVTRENVLAQLQHLRTHPVVAARLRRGDLHLHGWVYVIETGEVVCHDEASDVFMPMEERYARLLGGEKQAAIA